MQFGLIHLLPSTRPAVRVFRDKPHKPAHSVKISNKLRDELFTHCLMSGISLVYLYYDMQDILYDSLDNTVIHILRFWIHSMGCMCGPVLWFWLSISGRTESSWETRRCWRWRRRSTLNFLINVSCQITVVTPLCCVSAARCRCESARCGGVQVRGEGDPVGQHEESSVSGELQAQLWGERPPWCGRVGSHLGGNLTWPRSAS